MAISQSKYIAITSGIGGQAKAGRKELIARLFSTNNLIPTNTVLEFTSAANVSDYFGSSALETKCANEYFGWISKSITQPKKISFFRYTTEATAPYIRGTQDLTPLAILKAITDGSLIISMGGVSNEFKNINFSNAENYTDIANLLQTAIRSYTDGGALFTNATVQYNAINSSFILTGGETGNATIVYATPGTSGTDMSTLIGWSLSSQAIVSNGTDETTLQNILNKSIEISNNFASFGFLTPLNVEDIATIGNFCNNQNMQYMFCGDVGSSNYTEVQAEATKYSGMCLNYNVNYGIDNNLPAFLMPMIALAATNYKAVNSVLNYMYQQFPAQPVAVSSDSLSETLDNLNINYNGQTQQAGSLLNFYQDGFLADGTDIAIYCNEIWLKDAIATEILNLQLALNQLPANTRGESLAQGIITSVIEEAINNGTISIGKELNNTQKVYITNLLDDNEAWRTVQESGYILNITITEKTTNGKSIFILNYQLIYSKGDSIRKVEGQHILI